MPRSSTGRLSIDEGQQQGIMHFAAKFAAKRKAQSDKDLKDALKLIGGLVLLSLLIAIPIVATGGWAALLPLLPAAYATVSPLGALSVLTAGITAGLVVLGLITVGLGKLVSWIDQALDLSGHHEPKAATQPMTPASPAISSPKVLFDSKNKKGPSSLFSSREDSKGVVVSEESVRSPSPFLL